MDWFFRCIFEFEYLGENETEFENILTHWSVAQAGSNDDKNWGSKISLDCPFKPAQAFANMYEFYIAVWPGKGATCQLVQFARWAEQSVTSDERQIRFYREDFLLRTTF